MSTIQTNNTNLQVILDAVNALPDKVEEVTHETCNVYVHGISAVSSVEVICLILNTDNNLPEYITTTPPHSNGSPLPIPCIQNSILYCHWKFSSAPSPFTSVDGATVFFQNIINEDYYLICQLNSNGDRVDIVLA